MPTTAPSVLPPLSAGAFWTWVHTRKSEPRPPSLFRQQYNALGKLNLPAIERIVRTKYDRGAAFNRQHPFVDVLLDDIVESGETLDMNSTTVPPS